MTIELNQNWTLSFQDPKTKETRKIPAQVPGNTVGDLLRAGLIEDPYYGTNTTKLRPYEFVDWEYRTTFQSPALKNGEKLELVFEGVDTVFEVFVNGKAAGSGKNMFISHRFDITGLLVPGENQLSVKITSSVKYAREKYIPALGFALPYNYEGLAIRRAMHTYGWDIAPRIVGAGLWRKVHLDVIKPTHWGETYLFTAKLEERSANLMLYWNFQTEEEILDGFEAELSMSCKESKLNLRFPVYFVSGRKEFSIERPELWWPLGSGEQNQYEVTLRLFHDGKLKDERRFLFGLRTLILDRTESNENWSGRFCFICNGRKIFIKGSNWVPASDIHGEETDRIIKSLELFREAGCNMVRCWGGGIYEDHPFFDFCDKYGILVWQDFMVACVMPLQDDEFCKELSEEAVSVVRKLRQHPSLAFWSGDNECDIFQLWGPASRWKTSCNRITREVLPRVVFAHDPIRDYLPSSPYISDELTCSEDSPEQHLWGPRDTWKNPYYLRARAIFASELGYHGMTSAESTKKFIPPASLNERTRFNPDWLCHAAQPFNDPEGQYAYRIQLMTDQVEGFWGTIPESLEDFSFASQVVQAEAMKFYIENFRIAKWKRTGIIWWNMIDGWPQFSDAVVDYYFDRKLAFWYIKNIQKPILLAFDEPENWRIRLHGVNDLQHDVEVKYKVSDAATGEILMDDSTVIKADSAREIAGLKICLGVQKILRIDYECEGVHYVNHAIQGNAPFSKELYASAIRLAEQYYKK